MTWPTVAVTTTNIDAGTDSPATARTDLLDGLTKQNQMIAHVSVFGATLIDDATATAARTTLGAAALAANTFTGAQTMTAASIIEAEGADVVSAGTTNIWATDGNTRHITGATGPITSFGTAPQVGAWMRLIFDSTPTLQQGTNINLNAGGADVIIAAGDVALVYADTTTQFDVFVIRKSGASVVAASQAGRLLRITRYTTAGSGTWNRPADTVSVLIKTIGGGGGGGVATDGSGGGGGGASMLFVAAAASSYAYTVGAGGATDSAGGATSIAGIAGGQGGAGGGNGTQGGVGGTPTGGTINVIGTNGAHYSLGRGGGIAAGEAGGGNAVTNTAGNLYGGGGGGGATAGVGAAGYIELQEFS